MTAQECLKTLLNPETALQKRKDTLDSYMQYRLALGRNMKLPKGSSIKIAVAELFGALPPNDPDARNRLEASLRQVAVSAEQLDLERQRGRQEAIAALKATKTGTPIVIRNENREDVVTLLEVKRTRLICEYPDGRRCSAPVEFFVRVHQGKPPARLGVEEREQRDVIRALSGRHFGNAHQIIVLGGLTFVPALLDELGSALARIRDAPSAPTRGLC